MAESTEQRSFFRPSGSPREVRERIENALAEHFGRAFAVATGSGASAIYVLLRALGCKRICYPDLTCEAALNGALLLDYEPSFADVEASTGLYQGTPWEPAVAPEVMVATHLYGNLVDIPSMRRALPSGVFVLEDAAQGYGGRLRGRVAGALGDASVVSFGSGKAIDCGGGGAALMDDPALARSCRILRDSLCPNFEAGAADRDQMMQRYFLCARDEKLTPGALFAEKTRLKKRYRNALVYQADETCLERIERGLRTATERYDRLRARHAQLAAWFYEHPHLTLLESQGNPVPWRSSFFCDNRDALYTRLVQHGTAASRYFAPLHRHFDLADSTFPNASWLAAHVINLRLDEAPSIPALAAAVGEAASPSEAGLACP